MAKVLRWFGKNGSKQYNDDDASTPSRYLKTKHKVEWVKQHEISNHGDSPNNFDRDFGSMIQYRQELQRVSWKKHYSLPISPRDNNNIHNNSRNSNRGSKYSSKPPQKEISIDPRRFAIIDSNINYVDSDGNGTSDYIDPNFHLEPNPNADVNNTNASESNNNNNNAQNFSFEEKLNERLRKYQEELKQKQSLYQKHVEQEKQQLLQLKLQQQRQSHRRLSSQQKIHPTDFNSSNHQEQFIFNYNVNSMMSQNIRDDNGDFYVDHQRSETFENDKEILPLDKEEDETPAEIIIATKENLSRNSISSVSLRSRRSISNNANDHGKRLSNNININNSNDDNNNVEDNAGVVNIKNPLLSSTNVKISVEDYDDDNEHVRKNHRNLNSSNKNRNSLKRTSSNSSSSNKNLLNRRLSNRDSKRLSTSSIASALSDNADNAKTTIGKTISLKRNIARCNTCRKSIIEGGYTTQWCKICESKKFEMNFGTWTSGNDDIDCFILETQLNARSRFDYLEWIPFDRFKNVQYVGSGGLGSVHKAIWLDGPREKWDKKTFQYVCCGEWKVALKQLHNSRHVTTDFFDELGAHLRNENNSGNYITRYYGITRDPKTEDYMMVEQFARNGSLHTYIEKNRKTLTWKKRLNILFGIAAGITKIHSKNLLHKNLHSGNIVLHSYATALVSDLGLGRRADKENMNGSNNNKLASSDTSNGVYGVLPYVAPEILRGKPYTNASDIYSFGTLMWELAFKKKPFSHRAHDIELAKDICDGEQLDCEMTEIPKCYKELMQSCWNLDLFSRPTAEQLYITLGTWLCKVNNNVIDDSGVAIQFKNAEGMHNNGNDGEKKEAEKEIVDPEAIYISRFLKFPELQEPTIIFTRTNDPVEHLSVQNYIILETELYNLKYEMLQAENNQLVAEVYELLNYL